MEKNGKGYYVLLLACVVAMLIGFLQTRKKILGESAEITKITASPARLETKIGEPPAKVGTNTNIVVDFSGKAKSGWKQ
jgi:hypothetical protein